MKRNGQIEQIWQIPINEETEPRRLYVCRIGQDGKPDLEKPVLDLLSSYYAENPTCYAPLRMTRFLEDGDCVLTDETGTLLPLDTIDHLPPQDEIRGGNLFRPAIHYTPLYGWMNDPNGLVFDGSVYHLFYQHNPVGCKWGNMTWGHAISKDLFHWNECGDELFPDETGTMFSGSSYMDTENVSGFGKDALLLYYTAAGNTCMLSLNQPYTQRIAVSTDGGKTFRKLGDPPAVEQMHDSNRDKVVYCPELGKYLMAVYLRDFTFALLTSENLLDWERYTDLTMVSDNECPNFFPLDCEGERYWVLQGAHDKFALYRFENGMPVEVQPELDYHKEPGVSYAAQVFSGTGDRVIRIAWLKTNAPEAVFNSQMGVPCELFLKRVGDTIRLGSLPVRELNALVRKSVHLRTGDDRETVFLSGPLSEFEAIDLYLSFSSEQPDFFLSCFGMTIHVSPRNNTYSHGDCTAPLSLPGESGESKNIRAIFDTLGCEVFADNGLVYSTFSGIADRSLPVVLKTDEEPISVLADISTLDSRLGTKKQ